MASLASDRLTAEWAGAALGYTLASERLYCDFREFHHFSEELLGRPVWTHEFADKAIWVEMRDRFTKTIEDVLGG